MKKTAILLAFLVLLSFSCDKKYKFYAFDIKKTVSIEIPTESSEDFEITETIDLDIDNLFETNGTDAEMVEEISVEEVSLQSVDYLLFNDLKLFISAVNTNETMLANNDSINEVLDYTTGDYKTKLAVTEDRMDDFIKASNINIKTQAKLDTVMIEELSESLPDGIFIFTVTYNLRFRVQTYVK